MTAHRVPLTKVPIVAMLLVGLCAIASQGAEVPIPAAIEQTPLAACNLPAPQEPGLRYAATFESIGIYWAAADGAPGIDAAVRIPNFNDSYGGDAPDMGALELGSEFQVGVDAYRGRSTWGAK